MKNVSQYYFNSMFIEASRRGSKTCMIFLHGFPGRERNEDLATEISTRMGIDTYIVHYAGLNKGKGSFRFLSSITHSLQLVREHILEECGYEKIILFGYSWGATIAANVALSFEKHLVHLLLLAPLILIPEPQQVEFFAQRVINEQSQHINSFDLNTVVGDIETILATFNPLQIVNRPAIGENTTIIVCRQDTLINSETIKALASSFISPPQYIEIDQDHGCSNRGLFITSIVEILDTTVQSK